MSDSKNPFEKSYLGNELLVTTKNGHVITNIVLDVEALRVMLEDEGRLKDLSENAGYVTHDGRLMLKIKGIPLKNPDDNKSHFLVPDYYKK